MSDNTDTVTLVSSFSQQETIERLLGVIADKGLKLVARVDHQKGALAADVDLTPSELVIFGNPKVGSPLMALNPLVGLDLPQKMLVHTTSDGDVCISYNNPEKLRAIWGLGPDIEQIGMMTKGLGAIARQVAGL